MSGKKIYTQGQLFSSTRDQKRVLPRCCAQTRQPEAGSIAFPRAEMQPRPRSEAEQPSTVVEKGEPYPCSKPGQKLSVQQVQFHSL